jgi:hypothetical protein
MVRCGEALLTLFVHGYDNKIVLLNHLEVIDGKH